MKFITSKCYGFRMALITFLISLLGFTGCQKKGGEDNKAAAAPTEDLEEVGGENDDEKKSGDRKGNDDEGQNPPPAAPPTGGLALGDVSMDVTAVNSLDVTNSGGSQTAAATPGSLAISQTSLRSDIANADVDGDDDMEAVQAALAGIASGPPDGFRIWIKSIHFAEVGSDGNPTNEQEVFKKEGGAMIEIDGALVDLSGMLEALAGSNATDVILKAPVGTYDMIRIEFMERAEIKGCVKGYFDSTADIAEYEGVHEYCTQEAKSLYNAASGQRFYTEDYEKTGGNPLTAEWMKIQLAANIRYPHPDPEVDEPVLEPTTDETRTVPLDYYLPTPFTVTEGQNTPISMVIDLNGILRFYTGGHDVPSGYNAADQNTKMPAYFFDSAFRGSSYFFAGKTGKVYGYDMLSLVCEDTKLQINAGVPSCGTDEFFAVDTWMTLIMDPAGKPISMAISPKDDSRLTTLVGSHLWDGPWIFPGSTSDKVNLRYAMDSNQVGQYFRGTIYDFPANLDDFDAVVEGSGPQQGQFMLKWDLHDEDDLDENGNNIYPADATDYPSNKDSSGVVYFWRRL